MQTVPLVFLLHPVLAPDSRENKHKKNTNCMFFVLFGWES